MQARSQVGQKKNLRVHWTQANTITGVRKQPTNTQKVTSFKKTMMPWVFGVVARREGYKRRMRVCVNGLLNGADA